MLRTLDAARALPLFSTDLLQSVNRQRLFSDNLLQLCVLSLEFLETPGFRHIHAAVLVPPPKERLLGNVVSPTDIPNRVRALFRLSENPNDLLFTKSFLHFVSLLVQNTKNSLKHRLQFLEQVKTSIGLTLCLNL